MKRYISLLLVITMLTSMLLCPVVLADSVDKETGIEEMTEAELAAQELWDRLEPDDKLEEYNGEAVYTFTLPPELGSSITQEDLDGDYGKYFTSAVINDDESICYTVTKEQYTALVADLIVQGEEHIRQYVEDDQYAVKDIKYNCDFSIYDIYLSTDEVGINESLLFFGFYFEGILFSFFCGNDFEDLCVVVNYYDLNENLIDTWNSSEGF